MKKIVIALLFFAAPLFAQSPLTIEKALELGLKNSKQLMISKSKIEEADAKVTEVGSQMLPNLSFSANYTKLSDVKPFEVNIPFAPAPIKIQDPVLNNYSFKLSVHQPLFTGFKLSSLKNAAEYKLKSEEITLRKDINEEAMKIISSFWNLYKAQRLDSLVSESITAIENHLTDTKEFLKNGLVTKNDVLKLEVELSEAKVKKIEAENGVRLARMVFNKVVGLELTNETKISNEEINTAAIDFNYNELASEAVKQREEIQSLNYIIQAGGENITASRSGWFPSVFLYGNFYYNRPNQRILPLEDKFYDTWDAGVGVSWTLWDWGNRSSKTIQSEQQVFRAKKNLELIEDGIRTEVYKSYLDLQSAIEKVELNELTVKSAEDSYKSTIEKYNQQLVSSTELIDAETILFKVRTNLLISMVDLELAKIELKKSVGRKIY
ncbi:MAG: TolC family protein [Melioribacteraceae bacterium]|nr:TolC family protein [Melioribacteraceae bacterium]MCF8356714.1 TolC family protein [Melioribacteraceae bacterium]MCF8396098.1 TolC family protein [Melioribacteraceae bacterium]MCF8421084.1 TolC family protein [Melioribacteraceae bacterium]